MGLKNPTPSAAPSRAHAETGRSTLPPPPPHPPHPPTHPPPPPKWRVPVVSGNKGAAPRRGGQAASQRLRIRDPPSHRRRRAAAAWRNKATTESPVTCKCAHSFLSLIATTSVCVCDGIRLLVGRGSASAALSDALRLSTQNLAFRGPFRHFIKIAYFCSADWGLASDAHHDAPCFPPLYVAFGCPSLSLITTAFVSSAGSGAASDARSDALGQPHSKHRIWPSIFSSSRSRSFA